MFRFNPNTRVNGTDYVTSQPLPAQTDLDVRFHVLTNNQGGECARCRVVQHGPAWGGDAWVLCNRCAPNYGAPDLRAIVPFPAPTTTTLDSETIEARASGDYREEPLLPGSKPPKSPYVQTKRDPNFNPLAYTQYTSLYIRSYLNGCSAYRCKTYAAPARTIPVGGKYYLRDGRGAVCEPCFEKLTAIWKKREKDFKQCGHCEEFFLKNAHWTTTVYDGDVCGNCLSSDYIHLTLTDNGYVRADTVVYHAGDRTIASPQYAQAHWVLVDGKWWRSAAEADAAMFSVDLKYRNAKLLESQRQVLFHYGTNIIKMLGFPKATKTDSLCFGVELEMLPKLDDGKTLDDVVGTLGGKWNQKRPYILCRDGSLGDHGTELITLPFTLAAHKSDEFVPWKKILADLRTQAMSGKGTKACGMHVHINRRALSQLTMGKMLLVINSPEMQQLIVCISQRTDTGWAHRKFTKVTDGKKVSGDHYDALNIGTAKGTCELRIFRGNLRWERVMKNLEFTEALCLYSEQQSMRNINKPAELVNWIAERRGHYPHLHKFIAEHYKPAYPPPRLPRDWATSTIGMEVNPTEGDI